eukprot:TRINITY_DN353_c0_g2_i1.p1 TRINITY_DN353_c0_g2~~TRINITY_DN353_c0_g2_i1.p1  ORF type:complete len:771 (+),score=240.94 TRINITY_DN353_c0_g2_i1:55-2313(+)
MGLGKNLDGRSDIVHVSLKNDVKGLGVKNYDLFDFSHWDKLYTKAASNIHVSTDASGSVSLKKVETVAPKASVYGGMFVKAASSNDPTSACKEEELFKECEGSELRIFKQEGKMKRLMDAEKNCGVYNAGTAYFDGKLEAPATRREKRKREAEQGEEKEKKEKSDKRERREKRKRRESKDKETKDKESKKDKKEDKKEEKKEKEGKKEKPLVGRDPPVIVFINSRSGGQQGARVKKKFLSLLPEDQVFDLSEGGPEPGLRKWYAKRETLRVVACGGDGTAGWVLSVLDKLGWDPKEWPAVCVLPLGTGNDLSRILRWGKGYAGEDLYDFVKQVTESNTILPFDRWFVKYDAYSEEEVQKIKEEQKNRQSSSSSSDSADDIEIQVAEDQIPPLKQSRLSKSEGDIPEALKQEKEKEKEKGDEPEKKKAKGKKGKGEEKGECSLEKDKNGKGKDKKDKEKEKAKGKKGKGEEKGECSLEIDENGKEKDKKDKKKEEEKEKDDKEKANDDEEEDKGTDRSKMTSFSMNNYFSIGIDSQVCLDFHNLRDSHPGLFRHKLINFGWYGVLAAKSGINEWGGLKRNVIMKVDGKRVHLSSTIMAVVILNIPSYAGGTDLWGKSPKGYQPQSICDGLFEVVGIRGVNHMGRMQSGLSFGGHHIAQGKHVEFQMLTSLPVQVDGEPWIWPASKVQVTQHKPAKLLFNSKKDKTGKKQTLLLEGRGSTPLSPKASKDSKSPKAMKSPRKKKSVNDKEDIDAS